MKALLDKNTEFVLDSLTNGAALQIFLPKDRRSRGLKLIDFPSKTSPI